jgi:hypothetical protein
VSDRWSLAAWIDGADIRGRDGDASADIYFLSFGFGARFDAGFGGAAGRTFAVSMSAGLGALANGIVVDQNLRLDTWSLGGRGRGFLGVRVSDTVTIGVAATLGIFSAPLDADTWFNKPLRGTRYVVVGLGVDLSLGKSAKPARSPLTALALVGVRAADE